jgi:hypothetical protein
MIWKFPDENIFNQIDHLMIHVWDVDIHCDNHVHFRNRPAKTGAL